MKKLSAAILLSSFAFASSAFAGGTTTAAVAVQLADGYNAVGDVATNINVPRAFALAPVAARAGFVKSAFEAVLSANVIAGVVDSGSTNRMSVIAGSNKGYNVFTGSSVGGSVAQCGQPVAKDVVNLGASLVLTGSVSLTTDNACNRAL
jgi:hypothetical protein